MTQALPIRMTDTDCLEAILKEAGGWWLSHTAILSLCFNRYGHGMTVHSRAACLRKKGYNVQCEVKRGAGGRKQSYYRLAS